MSITLVGKKVAILTADGFNEHQMTEIQRALVKAKAQLQTIAPESGVVNGWQGDGWGHHFPVDAPIGETLGSDFDFLVLPGGTRSTEKLKQNAHARRIINHFLEADKPVAAIGEGVGLLALSDKVAERMIAAPVEIAAVLTAAKATLSEEGMEIDGNLLTSSGNDLMAWVDQAIALFAEAELTEVAA